MPPGERKSGIPEATEMPAPFKMAMDLHSDERMKRAKPAISAGAFLMNDDEMMMMMTTEMK
jgi:hypothetical protein